jgi:hypothetical protein
MILLDCWHATMSCQTKPGVPFRRLHIHTQLCQVCRGQLLTSCGLCAANLSLQMPLHLHILKTPLVLQPA